jgi:hypothetical protein
MTNARQVPLLCLLVNVGVRGEHAIEIVEPPRVDRGGVGHQQLLNFQPVRDLVQAEHVVD